MVETTEPRKPVLLLDDPEIGPLRVRIHEAQGHDWDATRCGACFDTAYRYIETSRLLALRSTSRDSEVLTESELSKALIRAGGFAGHRADPIWREGSSSEIARAIFEEHRRLTGGTE